MPIFSRKFKSSPHSVPSPSGRLVATLFPQSISIRCVESLEIVKTIKIPPGLSGNVCAFLWSPVSDKLLVAVSDQIHVFSTLVDEFRVVIRNPVNVSSKNLFIQFGPTGAELLVCSPFGLKFVIFDLITSRCFEIGNPKFFNALSAPRGFSFRPQTAHLALLTRVLGKDLVSLHHPTTRELLRSWHPNTIDAHQISWTLDGRWLMVCESSAHGHKLLFYTSDGHLFKTWTGPLAPPVEDKDFALGAGVRVIECGKDGKSIAVGDYTRCICVLDVGSVTETMRLQHPQTLTPSQTIQIWQEQVTTPDTGCSVHAFVQASQTVSPPPAADNTHHRQHQAGKFSSNNAGVNARNPPGSTGDELVSGTGLIAIDASTSLLASRLEDAPSTVWIWDIKAVQLRTVLMFHGHVSSLSWHPSARELLAIKCEGDGYNEILFAWDPLWESPIALDFGDQLTDRQVGGKARWSWLDIQAESAALFFADSKEGMFASLADSDKEAPPWKGQQRAGVDEGKALLFPSKHREESPLELIPAQGMHDDYKLASDEDDGDNMELEDTFRFKRFVGGRP